SCVLYARRPRSTSAAISGRDGEAGVGEADDADWSVTSSTVAIGNTRTSLPRGRFGLASFAGSYNAAAAPTTAEERLSVGGIREHAVLGAHCLRSASVIDERVVSGHNYVEWITKYEDGTTLTTRNAELRDLFDLMPHQIRQEGVGITDPLVLKARHDAKAAEL